jgi:hypothetical protein
MEIGDSIPVEEYSQVVKALETVPPTTVQAGPQMHLRDLAGQLPDLSNLENLTVNI